MYIYIYTFLCIYLNIFIFIHTYIHIFTYIYIHIFMYIYLYMYVCIYMYTYIYACSYTCIYVDTSSRDSRTHTHTYVNAHTHTHTHTHTRTTCSASDHSPSSIDTCTRINFTCSISVFHIFSNSNPEVLAAFAIAPYPRRAKHRTRTLFFFIKLFMQPTKHCILSTVLSILMGFLCNAFEGIWHQNPAGESEGHACCMHACVVYKVGVHEKFVVSVFEIPRRTVSRDKSSTCLRALPCDLEFCPAATEPLPAPTMHLSPPAFITSEQLHRNFHRFISIFTLACSLARSRKSFSLIVSLVYGYTCVCVCFKHCRRKIDGKYCFKCHS